MNRAPRRSYIANVTVILFLILSLNSVLNVSRKWFASNAKKPLLSICNYIYRF
jgi:hypothetical protein